MAWTILTPANATAGSAILASDHYAAFANINELRDTPSFLTDSDTATETGGASADFTYSAAEITLTPGTWLVQAGASLDCSSGSDAVAVAIWNQTTSAEVTNSAGAVGGASTTQRESCVSRVVEMVVSTNTAVRPRCKRNGASTIRASAAANAPAAYIHAQRVKTA